MSSKETVEKAYGNFSKEVQPAYTWDWIQPVRGFTYYYLKLCRFFTR